MLFGRTWCFRRLSFQKCSERSDAPHRLEQSSSHNFIPWSRFKQIDHFVRIIWPWITPYTLKTVHLCSASYSRLKCRNEDCSSTHQFIARTRCATSMRCCHFLCLLGGEERENMVLPFAISVPLIIACGENIAFCVEFTITERATGLVLSGRAERCS